MSDLIDRQTAIDALAKFVPYAICDESTESYTNGLTDAYNLICQMPSVQPERKKGRWVNNIDDLPICDQCGYKTPYDRAIDDYEYGNFCPNCGAEMKGGKNE